MLDPNLQSIISKAYAKIGDISYAIALKMKIGKNTLPAQRALFEQGIKMSIILKILTRQIKFDPVTNIPTLYRLTELQVNRLVRCLVQLGELNKYPVVPSLLPNVTPVILNQGLQGNPGSSITGPKGDPGVATDFSVINANTTVIVDSFLLTDAKAAKWEYFILSNTGKQRASTVIGHWKADGSLATSSDFGAEDLTGDTTGLVEFDINISGSNVQLVATISSETWAITGSREFIPRNGNGTGVVNNVLPLGQFYIGNVSNQAQAFAITGDVTFSPTGVASITANSIIDADINATANIALTKLASLNNNIVPITNGSGKLISSTLNPTTLGYVDIDSSLTGLLASKLTSPLTTLGDLLVHNGTIPIRLGIGTNNQVLTVVGGSATWQIRTESSGSYIRYKIVDFGVNLDMQENVAINHGLNYQKILSYDGFVYDNTRTLKNKIGGRKNFYSTTSTDSTDIAFLDYNGGIQGLDSSYIIVCRRPASIGGSYDDPGYSNALIRLIIWYEA